MTRIIAGVAGGRRISVPPKGTRPTTDRVREALFSTLESRICGDWSEVSFLDVFAGSGAVGLEAASRGARSVTLVEQARGAIAVLRKNIEVVSQPVTLLECSADAIGVHLEQPVTIAFLDPPYELSDIELARVLEILFMRAWIDEHTLIVLERSARASENLLDASAQRRAYGETVLWYGQFSRSEQEGQ